MKLVLKTILKILKVIFLLIIAEMACGGIFTVLFYGVKNIQVNIFLIYSLITVLTVFSYIFIDFKLKSTIVFVIVLSLYWWMLEGFPAVKYAFNLDMCYDSGICAENLEINSAEYGKILINRKNCTKYGWLWKPEERCCYIHKIYE